MKHITYTLAPTLLVGDDVNPLDLEFLLIKALTGATFEAATIETIAHIGRTQTEAARPGTCYVGAHPFYAPQSFPADRPVPDICPDHARTEEDAQVQDLHRPLFTEVTRLTGLTPLIWHSGGGCMTIVIPLSTPEPGQDWAAPCYMGLQEGDTDDGRWYGSVSFYATEEQTGNGDGVDIVTAGSDNPQHPHQWAAQIAEHHHAHTAQTLDQDH